MPSRDLDLSKSKDRIQLLRERLNGVDSVKPLKDRIQLLRERLGDKNKNNNNATTRTHHNNIVEAEFSTALRTFDHMSVASRLRTTSTVESLLRTNPCDFASHLRNVKVLKRSSASSAIMVLASLASSVGHRVPPNVDPDVFLKIFWPADSSSDVEIQVYHSVVRKMLRFTPHLMLSSTTFTCTGRRLITQIKGVDNQVEFLKQLNELADGNQTSTTSRSLTAYLDQPLRCLVLEQAKGIVLDDWIQKHGPTASIQEWSSIIFQMLYTLTVMERMGFQHNDLHTGNIWVEPATSDRQFYYNLDEGSTKNDMVVVVPVNWIVKIYDFDRSSVDASYRDIQTNTSLIGFMCSQFGQCPLVNPKFDLFGFIASLYSYDRLLPAPIFEWIKSNSDIELVKSLHPRQRDQKTGKIITLWQILYGNGQIPILVSDSKFHPLMDFIQSLIKMPGSGLTITNVNTIRGHNADNMFSLPMANQWVSRFIKSLKHIETELQTSGKGPDKETWVTLMQNLMIRLKFCIVETDKSNNIDVNELIDEFPDDVTNTDQVVKYLNILCRVRLDEKLIFTDRHRSLLKRMVQFLSGQNIIVPEEPLDVVFTPASFLMLLTCFTSLFKVDVFLSYMILLLEQL